MRTLQKVPEQRVCLERLRSSLTLTQSPKDLTGSFSKPPHHRQLSGKMEDKIRMWKNPNSHLRPTGCVLLLPQHKKKIRAAFWTAGNYRSCLLAAGTTKTSFNRIDELLAEKAGEGSLWSSLARRQSSGFSSVSTLSTRGRHSSTH